MAGRRFFWSEAKIERYLKNGKGQGRGKEYKPWITVESGFSTGNQYKVFGLKTERIHHFLSSLEYHYFLLLEWNDSVIDIRERFPLLNRVEAMAIAKERYMNYPHCSETRTPLIITTDFLVDTIVDGKIKQFARSILPEKKKNIRRNVERYSLEQEYWARRNIAFAVVSEKQLNFSIVRNYLSFRTAYILEATKALSAEELQQLLPSLRRYLLLSPKDVEVRSVCGDFDKFNSLPKGTAWYLFRHMLARKEITVDMNQKNYESCRIEHFK
ncbi:TnsA endonuclease N-terminal domain-containing protein [Paenibacillus sp. ACRSA]|uniref:TnsA endonuclease C-terminal domain-containing protein n=1 Tax=Paenibacillus sp. ACRSA TaxID=2918211 RepID=UPI001EF6EA6F|nr:TnsA endonuclease C-terminal domain-containing protein [Paenibacillus sp. ACRSA]MCG7377382.1 TnsA endonuclease N-terminal domain-containing protein [Paenibacillus sp. ACRSA]